MRIYAVIPVLNEQGAIGPTVLRLPPEIIDAAIVVDGNSQDGTVAEAREAGAIVLIEARRGYGRACLTGAEHAASLGAEIVVFMDGDGADAVEYAAQIVGPILDGSADFVLADRTGKAREPGSMGAHQIAAGRLIGAAVGLMTGVRYRDMCAFRALRIADLRRLDMQDMGYGWELGNADPRRARRPARARNRIALSLPHRRPVQGRRQFSWHAARRQPHRPHLDHRRASYAQCRAGTLIPLWPETIAAFVAAAAFFTAIGLPLARAVAPSGMPPLAMAPALGWAVFATLALPLLSVVGFGGTTITLAATAAMIAAALLWRRPPAPGAVLPRWAPPLAAGLAILPAMAVMPKSAEGGILLAPPIFDHVKIAIVDAILRSGLPVPNPFAGTNGAGHLAYYYLWHFSAASLASALHIGGWAAEAAMTATTGFAAVLLVMGAVIALGGRPVGVAAAGCLVLAGTARPVLSFLVGEPASRRWIEGNADLGGWLNQAAWVPQHLASACSLILAMLLMARLATRGGWLAAATLGVVVAAGFESSVWVGGVALAVTALLAGTVLLARTPAPARAAFVLRALAAAALTGLLIWPFIVADLGVVRSRHEGAGIALRAYAVTGTVWDVLAFWLVLLPFCLPAILPLALSALWRVRRSGRPLAPLFWMVAASCLGAAWLLRSTIDNNDLGWRAVLPAILLLTAIAAAELDRLARNRRVAAVAAAFAVAALAVPDTWHMARDYALGQRPGAPQQLAASQQMWQALRHLSSPLDRVANNPLFAGAATPWPVNIAWATLSDRPSCFSGWETMIAYGPLPKAELILASDLFARVFDGSATPSDVATLAGAYDCATVVVSRSDGAWVHDPFAAGAYRLVQDTDEFRIYKRK